MALQKLTQKKKEKKFSNSQWKNGFRVSGIKEWYGKTCMEVMRTKRN